MDPDPELLLPLPLLEPDSEPDPLLPEEADPDVEREALLEPDEEPPEPEDDDAEDDPLDMEGLPR